MVQTSRRLFVAVLLFTLCVFAIPPLLAATGTSATGGPNWTSLLPPLIAIGLAILLREVIGSLLLGILVGAFLLTSGSPGEALLLLPTDLFLNALANPGHAAIVLFSLMLGAMVGVLARSGGMAGIVRALQKMTRGRRGGMIVTWLMGLIIFFDDYANTLLVGNTMRPYADRLKLSRAKLAYIVDATSAPIASIAVISTWVGFEIGLIEEATSHLPNVQDGYLIFLQSIPFTAYSIFTLILVGAVAWWQRDFGPMLNTEKLALDGNDPSAEESGKTMESAEAGKYGVLLALVPVGLVILTTFAGLYLSGRAGAGPDAALFEILGAADSAQVLLAASFFGMVSAAILAVYPGRLKVQAVSDALIDGVKAMMPAMVILLLAWSLGDITDRLGTAEYVIDAVSGNLAPAMLPMVVFLIAAVIAFSTGTSWGVMAILIPIAIPLAYEMASLGGHAGDPVHGVFYGTVGAVLAGATFGDHCSPISDTTILSSMASGCKHIEHVRTQIPYALLAAGVSIVFGYLPSGLGFSPWIGLVLGAALIVFLPKLLMKPVEG
ncbi:Na+/H+ antiporter NhaC family protein [bacterium]|nr:Na+/H+ antiporter NhaC family protein [bacterium]